MRLRLETRPRSRPPSSGAPTPTGRTRTTYAACLPPPPPLPLPARLRTLPLTHTCAAPCRCHRARRPRRPHRPPPSPACLRMCAVDAASIDQSNATALMRAAMPGDHVDVGKTLIAHGADVHLTSVRARPPRRLRLARHDAPRRRRSPASSRASRLGPPRPLSLRPAPPRLAAHHPTEPRLDRTPCCM